jgi:hypothetical protein
MTSTELSTKGRTPPRHTATDTGPYRPASTIRCLAARILSVSRSNPRTTQAPACPSFSVFSASPHPTCTTTPPSKPSSTVRAAGCATPEAPKADPESNRNPVSKWNPATPARKRNFSLRGELERGGFISVYVSCLPLPLFGSLHLLGECFELFVQFGPSDPTDPTDRTNLGLLIVDY